MEQNERIEAMQKQLDELRAKERIREKLMLYSRVCDRMDVECADQIFAPDSHCDYGPSFKGSGRELAEWLKAVHGQYFTATSHQMTNMLVTVDGDRAGSETGHVGVTYSDANPDAPYANMSYSRYLDKWERREGDWFIVERLVLSEIAYAATIKKASPVYGSFSRDKNDPSYEHYIYKR